MQSYRLFLRLAARVRINWKLTSVAYLCTLLSMTLTLLQPFIFLQLIDKVWVGKQSDYFYPLLALSIGCALFASILDIIRDSLFRYLDIRTTLDLRNVVLDHLRKIPLAEIEKNGPGKFAPLLAGDTATMSNFVNRIIVEMFIQMVTMLVAIIMIFYMNWRLGLVVVVSIPLLLYIPNIFRNQLFRISQYIRSNNEQVGTLMYECIQGSREIRAFGLEAWERDRNEKLYKGLITKSTKETIYRATSAQMSTMVISAIIVLLYGFGSRQILNGTLTIGMLVAAITYFNNALRPIQTVNKYYGDIKYSEVAMERVENFLRIPTESAIKEKQDGMYSQKNAGLKQVDVISHDLHVIYEGNHILKGINLVVKSGQKVAIVGASGSGKTTLLKTLMGFLPITSGELLVFDRPLTEWSRSLLMKHVGMMFQESFIFAGTIYENIALGNLASTEEEVNDAAQRAGLKSLLDTLPEGLHTRIDNQGFQLSGGQRQRLAIARLILKKPWFLILDEPTSALDRTTETQVLNELNEIMKGRTTLISSHRLETIMSADVIYVMDQGKIIDSGTHATLIADCEIYKKLVDEKHHQTKLEVFTH
ncbi:ABC transporter ATP-binding protein [Cohnella endophytica]|uniref:ABC transporter ATP-binding protein n=1 Tax=Cohnella endophytica TaxID=2419778 RepID=A0A494XWZ7_9BACL|nr:ABC transporter ATP-binding protein [Cohnella endophytica]RKP54425.1 ABC transporter ATP-binding protein [Cohnella endophytica]